MRFFISFVVMSLCLSCNYSIDKQIFENDKYRAILSEKNGKCVHLELINRESLASISGTPELILVCGEVPERDYDIDPNDTLINEAYGAAIYLCDSTYSFQTKQIDITFAKEIGTRYRLSLSIDKSKVIDFVDGDYTFYNSKAHHDSD